MNKRVIAYPAGGWLPPGAHFDWQRPDQGRDFVTDWRGIIQAPARSQCVNVGSDAPFPNGFGPHYPWIKVIEGHFSGHTFYIGHCTALAHIGQMLDLGTPVARADQGHNFEGTVGGWVEFGEVQPSGILGPDASSHWFDNLLRSDLFVHVKDPDPNGYHKFANGPFRTPDGRVVHERLIVEEYDKKRAHWKLHEKRLDELKADLTFLKKRVWVEAHPRWLTHRSKTPSTWNEFDRGWRYKQLDFRSKGKRLGIDFHP